MTQKKVIHLTVCGLTKPSLNPNPHGWLSHTWYVATCANLQKNSKISELSVTGQTVPRL